TSMLSCPIVASVPFQMFPASSTLHVMTIPSLQVSVNFPNVMTWAFCEVNGSRTHSQFPVLATAFWHSESENLCVAVASCLQVYQWNAACDVAGIAAKATTASSGTNAA